MNVYERICGAFAECIDAAGRSAPLQRLARGDVGLPHYQSLLRQISHQARQNPQLQALTTMYLRGRQRALVASFLRHATSEVGHDQLALDDLEATGFDEVDVIPYENPLPATMALTAFAAYQIQFGNPLGYLGYLAFLELMPTRAGAGYKAMFRKVGVPENAFSFIDEHVAVDIGHNRAMERYLADLIEGEADLDSVLYNLRATAYLYEKLVESAFDWADTPYDVGLAHEELLRRRLAKPPSRPAPLHAANN